MSSFITSGVITFTVQPGKKLLLEAPTDIRLGQAVLDSELVDQKRSSLRFTFESAAQEPHDHDSEDEDHEHDEEESVPKTITLANLLPGVIEAQTLGGLIVSAGEKVILEVTGKNTVHLSGNIILQGNDGDESDDELPSEFDESEEEGASELDDEELQGLTEAEKNDFLKALSRNSPPPPVTTASAAATTTETKAAKKEKKDKKGKVETTTTTVTTSTTTATATQVKDATTKKRKEIDESPKEKSQKKVKGQDGKAVPAATPEKKEEKNVEKKEEKRKEEKKASKAETKVVSGGLKVTDKKVGEGPGAKPRQSLEMRYILKLGNGKIVDKNTSGKPFRFKLGAGEVIKGWDEGLVGMKVGGERLLEVPSTMGYGKRNMGDIPANSTLFFEVKLLAVK